MELDNTPRYVPETVVKFPQGRVPVTEVRMYPIGLHPKESCLVPDCTAVEVVTPYGSRWYGVEKAWINSELKAVVQGFNALFEEMRNWKVAKTL